MEGSYLPRIDVGDDQVLLGEAILRNEQGKCNIMAINLREKEVTTEVDPREIIPYEFVSSVVSSETESENLTVIQQQQEFQSRQRYNELLKLLLTGHLSHHEYQSIKRLVKSHPQVF